MSIGYDSVIIKAEHNAEEVTLERARDAMRSLRTAISQSDFALSDTPGFELSPDTTESHGLLADQLVVVRNFIAGKHLQNGQSQLAIPTPEYDNSTAKEYCQEVIGDIAYAISTAEKARMSDLESPGEGEGKIHIDIIIPGVKLADAQIRVLLSNDAAGTLTDFKIIRLKDEYPKAMLNPLQLSEESIDITPFEQRLNALMIN